MQGGIAGAFNIEKNEQSSVFVLILQSVFIGFFAGSLDVGAQSLFLSVYDASLIPKAFVISGIVGIIITSVYTRLQSRMRFSNFALLNFIFVALVTALLRLGFEFTDDKRLVFAVFVMMGPLTIISFLGFWGTVGRLFTLRQGKRLFGLIDTGQIFGIIVVSFAIPLLISLNFQVLDTLLLCTVSIIIALILQVIITRRFQFQKVEEAVGKKDNFLSLFKSRYTVLMALFIVFSVIAAFFVHFSFLTVLEENYPDPNALASFLGAFMGTLTIFTILIKTFVYGKMMKTYGLKLALLISPVLLGLFTFIAAIIGSVYGYTIESASFAFFFLLIVLSKLFAKSLKDSIEVPASKILYQSLDSSIRYNVQARIDGTVNELAAFSSGLLLAGLGMIAFVEIIHFSWFLLLMLLIWVIVGYRLYAAYKLSLESSLEKFQNLAIDEHEELPLLEKIIPGASHSSKLEALLEFAPQSWDGYVSKNIVELSCDSEKVRSLTLNIIDNLDLKDSVEHLDHFSKGATLLQQSRLKIIHERLRSDEQKHGEEEIRKLLKSENPDDRKKGLLVIIEKQDPKYYPRIVPMFRDTSPGVRISAIRAAGLLNHKDFVSYLVDMLEDPGFYSYAYFALCMMSEDILESLEHGFHKTGITEKGMIRITRIMASFGTAKAAKFLYGKLEHFNRNVFSVAVKGIQKSKIVPDENEKAKLFSALYRVAGITAWNLSAKHSLREFDPGAELVKAFDEEIVENYDMIYSLLSIAYDPATVFHIRKNLESGTSEGIGFAIELMDIFVDETVKPFLFPLLDDTPVAEKVRLLQSEYPLELMKAEDLLLAVINRDYNQINPYTRVCAIRALAYLEGFRPGKDLIAQMFNPDPLLREESSALMFRLEKESCQEVMNRLPQKYRLSTETFLKTMGTHAENGLFKKYRYLRENELFNSFKNHQLIYMARRFELIRFEGDEDVPVSERLRADQVFLVVGSDFQIEMGGGLLSFRGGELLDAAHWGGFSGEQVLMRGGNDTKLMALDKSSLQELVFDDEHTFFPIAEMIMPVNQN